MRENHELSEDDPAAPGDDLRLKARREQRADASRIETILWRCLRNRRFHGHKFRRQHSLGPYIADFYCDEIRLVVEADGPVHDLPERQARDGRRDAWLKDHGILVVRLPQEEILMATDRALKRVVRALAEAGRSTPARTAVRPHQSGSA